MRTLLVLLAIGASTAASAAPCDDLAHDLTRRRKVVIAQAVAKQLAVKRVEVLEFFAQANWSIVYVNTHETDETFTFFSGDPSKEPLITSWAGAAGVHEEPEILDWAHASAIGIPDALARCFAWYVTHGREL